MKLSAIDKYKGRYHFSVNFYSLFLIATFIPDVAGINVGLIKYSYWFVKVLLACMIIYDDKRPIFNINRLELGYYLLVFIYAVILFIDVFIAPEPTLARSEDFYLSSVTDFVGFILGVIIALSFRYDPVYHSERSFFFFWVSLTIALVISYFLAHEAFDLDVTNGRYDANSTINSIMYGQTGCAMALISILGMVNNKKNLWRALFAFTFLLGLISIGKAGSRSPIIVLAVVTIFYFIARVGIYKSLLILLGVASLIVVFINQIIAFLESIGSSLTARLSSMIFDNDSSGRDGIYANAWSLIKESPIVGSYYVIRNGVGAGGYPHNFLLEVFLATGLVGGIPFVVLLFISIYRSFKIIKRRHEASWIVVLYLQIVVYGMFSTGLYTSQDFWVLLFFVVSANKAIFSVSGKELKVQMATPGPSPLLN